MNLTVLNLILLVYNIHLFPQQPEEFWFFLLYYYDYNNYDYDYYYYLLFLLLSLLIKCLLQMMS